MLKIKLHDAYKTHIMEIYPIVGKKKSGEKIPTCVWALFQRMDA